MSHDKSGEIPKFFFVQLNTAEDFTRPYVIKYTTYGSPFRERVYLVIIKHRNNCKLYIHIKYAREWCSYTRIEDCTRVYHLPFGN